MTVGQTCLLYTTRPAIASLTFLQMTTSLTVTLNNACNAHINNDCFQHIQPLRPLQNHNLKMQITLLVSGTIELAFHVIQHVLDASSLELKMIGLTPENLVNAVGRAQKHLFQRVLPVN